MVAIQESINSRFCSVVEVKLSFFLKGGHLPRSGSRGIHFKNDKIIVRVTLQWCWFC